VTPTDESAAAPARPGRTGGLARILAGAWVVLVVAGMGVLWRYKSTAGPATSSALSWPDDSGLARTEGAPSLVVFVHPCCPCTRATLGELSALLPRFAEHLTIHVAAFEPAEPPPGWNESELPSALESLPEARFVVDTEGREARRFGAVTSGHVVLYGARGDLLYSGGVSSARGHAGESPGLARLRAALEAEFGGAPAARIAGAPVFGCALFDDADHGREAR
jgi:hypothetical protein